MKFSAEEIKTDVFVRLVFEHCAACQFSFKVSQRNIQYRLQSKILCKLEFTTYSMDSAAFYYSVAPITHLFQTYNS
jgi:hypothetical protein